MSPFLFSRVKEVGLNQYPTLFKLFITQIILNENYVRKTMNIQEKTRKFFKETIAQYDDLWSLVDHVPEVEKWANKIAASYPEADIEVLILSVWLHDIAYYIGDEYEDHAIKSERLAREFLTSEGLGKEKIDKVAHCVRSHRNKDVAPESIEAKILTVADSASHMPV